MHRAKEHIDRARGYFFIGMKKAALAELELVISNDARVMREVILLRDAINEGPINGVSIAPGHPTSVGT